MNKYVEIAKEIVLNHVDKENVTVFLFGSRAAGDFRHDSDIDIGFLSNAALDKTLFRKINLTLEESIVPYHIDLVDFSKADSDFKKYALEGIIIWNKGKNIDLK